MAEFPAFPLWTDAYLADTGHLSDAEHGIYLLILMHLWRSPGQKLPDDHAWLCRKMGRSLQAFETAVLPVMREFMHTDGNWWRQKRLSAEWDYVKKTSSRQSAAAKARWEKQKSNSHGNAERHESGNAPTPTPTPIKNPLRDAEASVDLDAELFGGCLKWLASLNGNDPNKYRSVIGRWVKTHGRERTLETFRSAQSMRKPLGDPVAWMETLLRPKLRKVPQI